MLCGRIASIISGIKEEEEKIKNNFGERAKGGIKFGRKVCSDAENKTDVVMVE
jgi:hypothetical protein